jgi:hypothetical protein
MTGDTDGVRMGLRKRFITEDTDDGINPTEDPR